MSICRWFIVLLLTHSTVVLALSCGPSGACNTDTPEFRAQGVSAIEVGIYWCPRIDSENAEKYISAFDRIRQQVGSAKWDEAKRVSYYAQLYKEIELDFLKSSNEKSIKSCRSMMRDAEVD